MGQLVFQATAGGQVALVGPNPSTNFSLNVPAVNSTLATLAAQTFTGQQTDTVDASISGLTVGQGALVGTGNTAFGITALSTNSSGGFNTAIGQNALKLSTSGGNSVAVGYGSLSANTTGSLNVAVGVNSLVANTTGGSNVALGIQALVSNTTASNNTAVGYQAGYSNTTGAGCVFIGNNTGTSSNANNNTFVGGNSAGFGAGLGVTSGTNNSFFGSAAGANVTTGSKNTIIGSYNGNQGGLDIRTASNYIVLSDGDGNPRGVFDGSGNFGIGVVAPATSQPVTGVAVLTGGFAAIGIGHVTGTPSGYYYNTFCYNGSIIGTISQNGTTGVLYNVVSDQRLKENIVDAPSALALIDSVKVRSFDFKSDGSHTEFGLIAQEFYEVAPECVSKGDDGEEITKTWGLDSSALVPAMIKAIQEQQALITTMQAKLKDAGVLGF